jgi:hypothetical protein
MVPVAVRPAVTGGQGQAEAEEDLPGEPPGEVCTANNCDSKHPEVCLVADHGKGKIPKATCTLWHMRIPFARGNSTGNSSNNNARPDKYLVKLEAEYRAEELKARIRATKMMLQGITYSQMVEGPPIEYRPMSYHAPSGLLSLRTGRLPYSRIPSSG